jgi:hypothetical protein
MRLFGKDKVPQLTDVPTSQEKMSLQVDPAGIGQTERSELANTIENRSYYEQRRCSYQGIQAAMVTLRTEVPISVLVAKKERWLFLKNSFQEEDHLIEFRYPKIFSVKLNQCSEYEPDILLHTLSFFRNSSA